MEESIRSPHWPAKLTINPNRISNNGSSMAVPRKMVQPIKATATLVVARAPSAPAIVLFGLVRASNFAPPNNLPKVKAATSLSATAVSSSSTIGR